MKKFKHKEFTDFCKVFYNTYEEAENDLDNDRWLDTISTDWTDELLLNILKELEEHGYSTVRKGYFYLIDENYHVHNNSDRYYAKLYKKYVEYEKTN